MGGVAEECERRVGVCESLLQSSVVTVALFAPYQLRFHVYFDNDAFCAFQLVSVAAAAGEAQQKAPDSYFPNHHFWPSNCSSGTLGFPPVCLFSVDHISCKTP